VKLGASISNRQKEEGIVVLLIHVGYLDIKVEGLGEVQKQNQ
jgi:hypothetical protein